MLAVCDVFNPGCLVRSPNYIYIRETQSMTQISWHFIESGREINAITASRHASTHPLSAAVVEGIFVVRIYHANVSSEHDLIGALKSFVFFTSLS